jgi:FKBP-type peptidyl-prolyl cis-trans isomerase FkpA
MARAETRTSVAQPAFVRNVYDLYDESFDFDKQFEILDRYAEAAGEITQRQSSQLLQNVKEDGEVYMKAFLEAIEEAVQTSSGLIYCSMFDGSGPQPTADSKVEVHYQGKVVGGMEFDNTMARGEPITLALKDVVPGLQEGLKLMKEGGRATLVIPSHLAYGDSGSGNGMIPAGATIKFEVELLKVAS